MHQLWKISYLFVVSLTSQMQIPSELKLQPELHIGTEKTCQPHCSIRRNGTLSTNQFIDTTPRYPKGFRQFFLRYPARGKVSTFEKNPRMRRRPMRRPKKTRALARVISFTLNHYYFLKVREPLMMALIMVWRDMTSSRNAA